MSSLVPLALLFLGWFAPSPAPEVRFDKNRHLEDWEEHFFSDWSDLYDFQPFLDADGETISEARLEELRLAWSQEVERVAAEAERIRSSPLRLHEYEFRQELKRHTKLSKVGFVQVLSAEGLLFYVEDSAGTRQAGRARRLGSELGLWLRDLHERFRRDVADPCGLTREPSDYLTSVVLTQPSTYGAYAEAASAHLQSSDFYDPELECAVLYTPADNQAGDRKRSAKHAFVHGLCSAYALEEGGLVESPFLEGLACYLAEPRTFPGESAWEETLRTFLIPGEESKVVRARPQTLERMLSPRDFRELAEDVSELLRSSKIDRDHFVEGYWDTLRQAVLFVRFLFDAQDGVFLGEAQALARVELTGRRGPTRLLGALDDTEPEELVAGFRSWLESQAERLQVSPELAGSVLAGDFGAGWAADTRAPKLRLVDATDNQLLARAVWKARTGRMSAARTDLEELLPRVADPAFQAQVERELHRIRSWESARNQHLRELAQTSGRVEIQHEGRTTKAKVRAFEAPTVFLEDNRSGLAEIPAEEIEPMTLAMKMARVDSEHRWARFYPYVLNQDERCSRLLDDTDPDSAALRSDAEETYPNLLLLGEAYSILTDLADRGAPEGPLEAEQQLGVVGDLVERFSSLEIVQTKHAALRGRAAACWDVLLQQQGLDSLLAGQVKSQTGDRYWLTYDFEDPEQLNDFEAVDYLSDIQRHFCPEMDGTDPKTTEVRDGNLLLNGLVSLRLVLPVHGATRIRYGYEMAGGHKDYQPGDPVWLSVLLCDDGKKQRILVNGGLHLYLESDGGHDSAPSERDEGILWGDTAQVEIEHDGSSVRVYFDDEPQSELPVDLTEGNIVILCMSEFPILIKSFEVEASVGDRELEVLRQRLIERKLAEF